jgi:hypothetical protein
MENHLEDLVPLLDREVEELMTPTQFMILSIASFGLYPIWWSYKAWVFFRDTEGADVLPAVRALFSWLFLSSLLQRIKNFSIRNGDTSRYNTGLLHLGYLLLIFSGYLPEPFLLISVLNAVIFIEPLKALNFGKSNSPEIFTKEKTSFNTRQWVLIIVGSLFLILAVVGFLLGEEPI